MNYSVAVTAVYFTNPLEELNFSFKFDNGNLEKYFRSYEDGNFLWHIFLFYD